MVMFICLLQRMVLESMRPSGGNSRYKLVFVVLCVVDYGILSPQTFKGLRRGVCSTTQSSSGNSQEVTENLGFLLIFLF